ncbi:MAG: glycosyltransferase family 4 protein [Planctomycetes bacterium]|nr:glycosyltransferase family 4 protein [Planctomycetota bacterium]
MKICIISYEYEPFPGGGIATYHNAAAKILAAAGHEVHVVTNFANHGSYLPQHTHRLWTDGNLTIHRLFHFDERREVRRDQQFLDVVPHRYGDRGRLWASESSNIAGIQAAAYVEQLHLDRGLDVIESPEFFAEAFYVIRARHSGRRASFPPVCVHGHVSSRIAFATNRHPWELGYHPHRQMMLREEYCVQNADALLTPSHALMARYREQFGDRLPELQRTIPYFLDLPSAGQQLPRELEGGGRFLVCVGRIEPRKGSDDAMRAFARLASDYPDLKLAFLGKEMWHQGESVDEVVEALVPAGIRNRVLRLGNVPREQALAAMQRAAAFLHPAPWDNYPCATLEAMGVGAMCVVSDQGGQAEMVEHGRTGLVHRAGDVDGLVAAIRTALDDADAVAGWRQAARAHALELTDAERLVAAKIELFEAMLAREAEARTTLADRFFLPPALHPLDVPPALPGRGVVVIDAGGQPADRYGSTRASIDAELRGSPGWRVVVLRDPSQSVDTPAGWTTRTTIDAPAWNELEDDDTVVWVLAGVRFDLGRLRDVAHQPGDAPVPCGSFAWLRPASAQVFPYSPDCGFEDLLIGGHVLPPVFAVKARHLRRVRSLSGLFEATQRLAALLAAVSAANDMMLQHTGEVLGDFYGDLPLVSDDVQLRAIGFLEILGLMPRRMTMVGNLVEVPNAPVAPPPAPPAQAPAAAGSEGQQPAASTPANNGNVSPVADLATLEKVYYEHMRLKELGVVRMIRKLGLFDVARKVMPGSKKFIGPGKAPS